MKGSLSWTGLRDHLAGCALFSKGKDNQLKMQDREVLKETALEEDGFLAFMADAFIIFFAGFTLAQQFSFFAGFSFRGSWLLGGIIAMIGIFWFWKTGSPPKNKILCSARNINWFLWLGVIVAVGLTLFLHRPDSDDASYIGMAVLSLDNMTVPMQSIKSNAKLGQMLTSYEFLRAAFSKVFNIPLLISYYLIWPAIVAAVVVVFQWRLLRLLAVKSMVFALVMFFIVMLGWGDVHRTPANFGFVRFFQGKGGLIWLAIPSAIYYWLRFVVYSERRALALLLCSIVAGIGFSATGAPIGVLLVGIFIIATLSYSGFHLNRKNLIGLAVVITVPLVIGLLFYFYFKKISMGVHTQHGIAESTTTWEMIKFVIGDSGRGIIALLCLAILPWTLRKSEVSSLFKKYSIICILLLAFPLTSNILGRYGYTTMSWRWLYVVPFVLALVVAADRLICLTARPIGRFAIMAFIGTLFLAISPTRIISEANHTQIRMPSPKLENQNEIFLSIYWKSARIENFWLISPVTGNRL